MSYKIFRFLYLSVGAVFLVAALALGGTLYNNGKLFLMPGPLSEMAARGEALEGYSSHSEFEQSCGHCHTPVHCITDNGCQDCHNDVARQRSTGEGLHARLPGTGRCQNCHIEHKGRDMVLTDFAFANIDHALLSGFSLDKHQLDYDGSHLGCESCHNQSRFVSDTLDCISCHSQEDHDYMAAHIQTYGLSCVPCHDGLDTMAAFVHEEVYPLDGAHADAQCSGCHAELAFAGTPSECRECHEKTLPYAVMFGSDCQRCHTTVAWAPALLTQHTFSLSHGGDEQLACESCHVGEYAVKSCYECHDHQPDQMLVAHLAEQVYLLDRCEECHPTGKQGEAGRLRAQWEPLRASEAAWIENALLYNAQIQEAATLLPEQPGEIVGTVEGVLSAQPASQDSPYPQGSTIEPPPPGAAYLPTELEEQTEQGEEPSAGSTSSEGQEGKKSNVEQAQAGEGPAGVDNPGGEEIHGKHQPH
jgi:hypothetical protein